jgi:class 3 adenylate cyclase
MAHRLAGEEPQFPAMHAGVHYGPVLYRDGDYLGSTVNIAARRRAGELTEIAFHPLGTHDIKGIEERLELYRAENTEGAATPRRTDPVCGMQLRDDEIAARMTVGTEEQAFCSTHCLQVSATRTSAPA